MTSDETIPSEGSLDSELSDEFVTISRSELEVLRSRSRITAEKEFGEASLTESELAYRGSGTVDRELGRESPLKKELKARGQRVASLEKLCKEAVRDREVATMLVGKPLVAGAAAQLIKLWRDEFDVYEEDGTFKIAARDGRKPSQVISEWLASVDYSHFCLPASRGGTGARDANRPGSMPQSPEAPKNLGEAIVLKWREESVSRVESMAKPIGLKRRR